MADETTFVRIRCKKQNICIPVGKHEIFEEGDVIDVEQSLLKNLPVTNWEKVGKNTKTVRNPVKFYTTLPDGKVVLGGEESADDAKAKATQYAAGGAVIEGAKTLADV